MALWIICYVAPQPFVGSLHQWVFLLECACLGCLVGLLDKGASAALPSRFLSARILHVPWSIYVAVAEDAPAAKGSKRVETSLWPAHPPARWATLQSLQTSLSRLSNRPPSISIFAPADPPAPPQFGKSVT